MTPEQLVRDVAALKRETAEMARALSREQLEAFFAEYVARYATLAGALRAIATDPTCQAQRLARDMLAAMDPECLPTTH